MLQKNQHNECYKKKKMVVKNQISQIINMILNFYVSYLNNHIVTF